jgi:hypothetical protein
MDPARIALPNDKSDEKNIPPDALESSPATTPVPDLALRPNIQAVRLHLH